MIGIFQKEFSRLNPNIKSYKHVLSQSGATPANAYVHTSPSLAQRTKVLVFYFASAAAWE
jgi:hypothetical protein